MADIAVGTADQVRRLNPHRDVVHDGIAAVAITAGQVVYFNSAGKLALGDGSAAGTATIAGIALHPGAAAGDVCPFIKVGKTGGFTISGLAYGAYVYLSDTAGSLADAAGTVSLVLGRVVASSESTPQKQLFIDINYSVVGV